ncbi:hypothetical protein I545_4924 [Mycobacterium kansasii 662]|uniref:Uncharacterized protein n=1 Tax=Mycobacterium kansasii 662 TaxID=1299326 RepID=X7Z1H5_MYCKA|nr:hypothetical protein I545_4924 [Mycobacterium kansasii 662]
MPPPGSQCLAAEEVAEVRSRAAMSLTVTWALSAKCSRVVGAALPEVVGGPRRRKWWLGMLARM